MEVPMEAAMPCKKRNNGALLGFRKLNRRVVNPTIFQRQKHVCFMEAHEFTRKRSESCLPKGHEDHVAGKGYNSMTRLQPCAQVCSDASSDENSGCESSSGQGMEETRNDASLAVGRGIEQQKVILEAQREKKKVHFASLMDSHFKNAE